DGRLAEFDRELEGGVGVVEIVEAELLALDLRRGRDARTRLAADIEGGLLVRVFAIAQPLAEATGERQHRREGFVLLRREPLRDGGVVGGGPGIGEAG